MTLLTDQKNTTRLFDLDIQNQTFAEAHQLLMQTARTRGNASKVVVTPNVDHIVRLDQQAEFKQLYSTSDLIFADGMPGQETELLAAFARVYPGLRVDLFCPSMQFTPEGAEADEAIRRIRVAKPHIVFICLGMPKQEYFAFRYRREESTDNAPLLMCVGAAMEFALGQKQRAPLWMQKIGMEWFWRLASEPRRLWQRYTIQGSKFFGIMLRELKKTKIKRPRLRNDET